MDFGNSCEAATARSKPPNLIRNCLLKWSISEIACSSKNAFGRGHSASPLFCAYQLMTVLGAVARPCYGRSSLYSSIFVTGCRSLNLRFLRPKKCCGSLSLESRWIRTLEFCWSLSSVWRFFWNWLSWIASGVHFTDLTWGFQNWSKASWFSSTGKVTSNSASYKA